MDGFTAKEIFSSINGITYADIILLPGYIDFAANDVSLKTKITKRKILID